MENSLCMCAQSLSCVRLFVTPWTIQLTRLLCPWASPGRNTGVGSHSLLQGIFPTQGSNLGLLHCRQILYHLSHQGSPIPLCVCVCVCMCTEREREQNRILSGLKRKEMLSHATTQMKLDIILSETGLYLLLRASCQIFMNSASWLNSDGQLEIGQDRNFQTVKCGSAFTNWGQLIDKYIPAQYCLLLISPWPIIVIESQRYREEDKA